MWFEDLEEIGDACELECRKNNVTINLPFQIGIVVYQFVKVRVLEFYYNVLDYFVDRNDSELIPMDTDSLYLGLPCDTLEEAVRPELLGELKGCKKCLA